jgi:hypothetical protein
MTRYLYDLDQHAELQRTAKLDNWLWLCLATQRCDFLSSRPDGNTNALKDLRMVNPVELGERGIRRRFAGTGIGATVGVSKNRSVQVMKFHDPPIQLTSLSGGKIH